MTAGVGGPSVAGDSSEKPDISQAARNSASVAVWTLGSRITGLVRIVAMAAVLGPTFFGNIVQTTNLLPYFVYNILAGAMLTSLLVPPLTAALDNGDREGAERLVGGFLGSILSVGVGVGFAVVLAGPLLSRLLVIRVDPGDRDAALRIASLLLVMVVPQVLLLAVAGVGVAAQNSSGRFALAAAASIFENVGIVATLAISASVYGIGIEVDDVSDGQLALLIVGLTASVGLHAAVQWYGAWRSGITIKPRLGFVDPEVRAVLRLLPASIGSTALTAARYLALSIAASTVPGGVSAVQVAISFYNLPVALGSFPISTALLPQLSRVARTGDGRAFSSIYDVGLRLAWFLAVPAAIAIFVLSPTIADAVALGAMDSPEAIDLIAVALATVSIAVIGEASLEVSRRASYAYKNARLPFQAMLVRAAVTVVGLSVAFMLDGLATIAAVGLTVTAGDLASAWWLDRSIRRFLGVQPVHPPVASLVRNVTISMVMGVTVMVVAQIISRTMVGSMRSIVALGVASLVGLVVYGVIHRRSGSIELEVYADLVTGRKGKSSEQGRAGGGDTRSTAIAGMVGSSARAPDLPLDLAIVVVAAVGAVGVGYVATMLPVVGLLGVAGLGFFVAVMARPQLAAYTYAAFLPFLAGIERGQYIPYFRLTEVLQVVLTAALITRFVLTLLAGAPIPKLRLTNVDRAFIAFATFASVVPVGWSLLRGIPLTQADLLSTIPIWKYYALFLLIRASVKEVHQARTTMVISIFVGCITGVVATFQALDLFGAPALLATFWAPPGTEAQELVDGRGSSFLASSIATASYVTYNLGIAVALFWNDRSSRWFAGPMAVVLTIATFGTGQITGLLSMLIVVFVVAALSGRLKNLTRTSMAIIPLSVLAVWPVLNNRINETESSTGLPQSWVVRWDNLSTFYWPELRGWNWIFGVRPDSVVAAPETWREQVFLESGYTWLIWVGGLPLVVVFLLFARTLLRRLYGVIELRSDAVGVAALAAFAAYITIASLAIVDMHITTRGEADITYVLCGLALSTAPIVATRRRTREGLVGSGQLPTRLDPQAGGRRVGSARS